MRKIILFALCAAFFGSVMLTSCTTNTTEQAAPQTTSVTNTTVPASSTPTATTM